jgi:tetratricopeptide (TPR) repeat protein
MKIKRGPVIAGAMIVLMLIAVLVVSLYQKNRARGELAGRIFADGGASTPQTVGELRRAISSYENRIEQHVQDAAKTGSYWKILAVRLSDRGLHGEALEALENAIYYTPEDPALHYYTGVSAGVMAKSKHAFPGSANTERQQYLSLAEDAYLRAIELDNRYLRPRYGLSVLYVFELERPEDALPHLERYLEISRNDVDTMFVLARAFYMLERYTEAVELYDRIITLTRDEQKKIEAQNNRQAALGRIYG